MSTERKSMSSAEREVRIELVRARAALERRRLLRGAERLAQAASPAELVRGIIPPGLQSLGSSRPSDWVAHAVSLGRRYPMLLSGLTSLIPMLGRRRRLLRLGAGLLLSWQIARKAGKGGN